MHVQGGGQADANGLTKGSIANAVRIERAVFRYFSNYRRDTG